MKSSTSNLFKSTNIILFVLLIFIMTSCAETIDLDTCLPEKTLGFWWGLLHGFISFFTFIISLFKDEVAIYAVNNNGGWYNAGFILGIMSFYGGGTRASRKKKRY